MEGTIKAVSLEAEKELENLPSDLKARFLRISELMESFGPVDVGMPHIKFLGDKLWEIRLHGKTALGRSVFIMIKEKEIIILNTFIKKTQKTPLKELRLAKERLKRWKNAS